MSLSCVSATGSTLRPPEVQGRADRTGGATEWDGEISNRSKDHQITRLNRLNFGKAQP